MGLCPSRNSKASATNKHAQTFTPLEPSAAPTPTLRADAQSFVPKPAPEPKEAWEQFLDQKQQETKQPTKVFNRKNDGTFTQDYRKLLDGSDTASPLKKRYVPPQQRGGGEDWVQEWKRTEARKPLFRPPPGLPVTRMPHPALTNDAKLKEAMLKVKQLQLPKDAVLEQLEQLKHAKPKDDANAPSALVPFGLTDSHYLSDDADAAESHRHCSAIKTKLRSYVPKPPSAQLEASMTVVLHCLRQLKSAEAQTGLDEAGTGKRYCVGIREVARVLRSKDKSCSLKAVLVAPDVEADGTTARGALDDRLNELIAAAAARNIPVIYGLSRTRLGQAIKKSVTISVLGVLSVRGMQEPFEQMLQNAG